LIIAPSTVSHHRAEKELCLKGNIYPIYMSKAAAFLTRHEFLDFWVSYFGDVSNVSERRS
jgi:hypothetical protein